MLIPYIGPAHTHIYKHVARKRLCSSPVLFSKYRISISFTERSVWDEKVSVWDEVVKVCEGVRVRGEEVNL